MNTCVVRQSAEDKAYGRLSSLRPLKEAQPDLVINLMGCLVGVKDTTRLKERFPYVDVFSPPSDPGPLLNYLPREKAASWKKTRRPAALCLDGRRLAPAPDRSAAAWSPVLSRWSTAARMPAPTASSLTARGIERSRPPQEILAEARSMVAQGVKEITLLGQIVDRYGKDDPALPSLAGLLQPDFRNRWPGTHPLLDLASQLDDR